MVQRGRKSASNLIAPNITGERPRLTAPASLTTHERKLFTELVNACDSHHFRASDLPLLISFIQTSLLAQAAAGDASRFAAWEKTVKLQAVLAAKLRLCPSSRSDPKTIGRQDRNGPRLQFPWEGKAEYAQRCRDAEYEGPSEEGEL